MSELIRDLQINLVLPQLQVTHRNQALSLLTMEIAGVIPCAQHVMLERFLAREQTQSSGVGDGVAIPHLQISQLERPFGAIATLKQPVDFNAQDNRAVDLIFVLLSPERDGTLHLRRLAGISRLLRNADLCEKIRDTADRDIIRALLLAPEGWLLAA